MFGIILLCLLSHAWGTNVVELTASNFDSLVINSKEIWFVEFCAPKSKLCQKLAPKYRRAANVLKGAVKVGTVNGEENKLLVKQFEVDSYPTIKIFSSNKTEDFYFHEKEKTVDKMVDAAAERLKNNVIELTDSNFDDLVIQSNDSWVINFFAPWCRHSKRLAPHFGKAAMELKGKVKFGALDATGHTLTADNYNIEAYPTIKFLPQYKSGYYIIKKYNKEKRTVAGIIRWTNEKLSEKLSFIDIFEFIVHYSNKTV